MVSLNKAMIAGRLAAPPCIRTSRGKPLLVGLSILTVRRGLDVKSEKSTVVKEYHRVLVADPRYLEFAAGLTLGCDLYVEGELYTHFWQDDLFNWLSLTKIIVTCKSGHISLVTEDFSGDTEPSSQIMEASSDDGLFTLPNVAETL